MTDLCTLTEARATAHGWHGGGGSPLYQFASTGRVHSEEHKVALLTEIDDTMRWCQANPETEESHDLNNLRELRHFIAAWEVTQ